MATSGGASRCRLAATVSALTWPSLPDTAMVRGRWNNAQPLRRQPAQHPRSRGGGGVPAASSRGLATGAQGGRARPAWELLSLVPGSRDFQLHTQVTRAQSCSGQQGSGA